MENLDNLIKKFSFKKRTFSLKKEHLKHKKQITKEIILTKNEIRAMNKASKLF